MQLALIKNGAVQSIQTITDQSEVDALAYQYDAVVDVTNMSPQPVAGWLYDGVNLTGAPVSMVITKLALRQRLTFTELCNLTAAANPGSSTYNIAVQALMGNLQVTTFVDLKRADTAAAVGLIVALGLITADRAAVILNTPPGPLEVYHP